MRVDLSIRIREAIIRSLYVLLEIVSPQKKQFIFYRSTPIR